MNVCPGCLKKGFETFCPVCKKQLFAGKTISHVLPFTKPEFIKTRLDQAERLSISGVQIKHSVRLENKQLILTEHGGQYILKPVPADSILNVESVPANEHLTMQIAKQVFKLKIPPNALVHFLEGEPAYLVKRFDVLPDGKKLLQEDFAQVAGKSEENSGGNYKYDFSYEEIAGLMKKFIPAYLVEVERFYSLVVCNYIVGNGDAHLKNFSVFRNEEFGDYTLTPGYDLLNTSIHFPNEKDTALELFKDDFMTEAYKSGSKYTKVDLVEFGLRISISQKRIEKLLGNFLNKEKQIEELVTNSFLDINMKAVYLQSILNRLIRISE
jgi:serine/threonine-protein kinase HipA